MKRATLVFCGVAAFASCCFGTLVLDCDTDAQINGIGTSVSIPSGVRSIGNSAFRVSGPAMPSSHRPFVFFWKALTAAAVTSS